MKFNRKQLVGYWFRQKVDQSDTLESEYCHFQDDGIFKIDFINTKQGKTLQQITEYGSWGLVGDIHFTITEEIIIDDKCIDNDMSNENNYNAYRVLQLNSQFFEYEHIETKEKYLLKRTMATTAIC
jgi:hypothetical protein